MIDRPVGYAYRNGSRHSFDCVCISCLTTDRIIRAQAQGPGRKCPAITKSGWRCGATRIGKDEYCLNHRNARNRPKAVERESWHPPKINLAIEEMRHRMDPGPLPTDSPCMLFVRVRPPPAPPPPASKGRRKGSMIPLTDRDVAKMNQEAKDVRTPVWHVRALVRNMKLRGAIARGLAIQEREARERQERDDRQRLTWTRTDRWRILRGREEPPGSQGPPAV